MKPFPPTTDGCYASVPLTSNNVKSICAVTYKAAVNASGVVRLTPLSTATFNYAFPGAGTDLFPMPCKDMNASGLLSGKDLLPDGVN
jgi:hypothetical protein